MTSVINGDVTPSRGTLAIGVGSVALGVSVVALPAQARHEVWVALLGLVALLVAVLQQTLP
jgi:hypothetical protein